MSSPKSRDIIPIEQRRGLTKIEAAAYVGVCASTFDAAIREGKYPAATLPGQRWDKRALDAALDKLSGLGATSDPYDEWRRGKRGRAG